MIMLEIYAITHTKRPEWKKCDLSKNCHNYVLGYVVEYVG